MSRGSSVGSSSISPTSTSRSTSTWRVAPWQACTWTDRSPADRTPLDRASPRRSACSRPSRVRGLGTPRAAASAARPPGSVVEQWRRRSRLSRPVLDDGPEQRQRPLQLPGVPPQRREQRVLDHLRVLVVEPAHAARVGRLAASSHQAAAETCGSHRCTSRTSPTAREQLELGDRQPGVPEHRQPGRQRQRLAFADRLHGLGVPDVGRWRRDAVEQRPPQVRLPGEVDQGGRRPRRRWPGPRASR